MAIIKSNCSLYFVRSYVCVCVCVCVCTLGNVIQAFLMKFRVDHFRAGDVSTQWDQFFPFISGETATKNAKTTPESQHPCDSGSRANQNGSPHLGSVNEIPTSDFFDDVIQPSHPLLPPSPPALSLFQWVGSLNQAAKVLELQLQHQSFQLIFTVGFL